MEAASPDPTIDLVMNDGAENITPALVDDLDAISVECPNGQHTKECPFQKISGLSRQSRRYVFAQMNLAQVGTLFDLASDCPACPKDPRRKQV